jgi:hypothetical protein
MIRDITKFHSFYQAYKNRDHSKPDNVFVLVGSYDQVEHVCVKDQVRQMNRLGVGPAGFDTLNDRVKTVRNALERPCKSITLKSGELVRLRPVYYCEHCDQVFVMELADDNG